jgi:hypothetical protein
VITYNNGIVQEFDLGNAKKNIGKRLILLFLSERLLFSFPLTSVKDYLSGSSLRITSRGNIATRTENAKFYWHLKVPKCEIFDHSDFPDFYTIKSSWISDLVVKILTCYLNF